MQYKICMSQIFVNLKLKILKLDILLTLLSALGLRNKLKWGGKCETTIIHVSLHIKKDICSGITASKRS